MNRDRKQTTLLCSLNTCSVRNKTADILDYACDCKADMLTFAESWLVEEDVAVKAEICPDGTAMDGMGVERVLFFKIPFV